MEFPRLFVHGTPDGMVHELGPWAQPRVIGVEAAEIGIRNTVGGEAVAYGQGDAIESKAVKAQHAGFEQPSSRCHMEIPD
jgi:hypothetical protein